MHLYTRYVCPTTHLLHEYVIFPEYELYPGCRPKWVMCTNPTYRVCTHHVHLLRVDIPIFPI